MARDKTVREQATERNQINRRSYLKLAGAAAASLGAVGVSSQSVDAASYDTITVGANERRVIRLGDGDTLENTLIDITASGAEYRLNASGDGWAIRNVGIRGRMDPNVATPWVMQGNGTVENVYLGDGGRRNGMFVLRSHGGEITLDRVYIAGFETNGLYGSPPGNGSEHSAPGSGGTVKVTNSYAKNNGIANFRLGTDGSYCKNCVSVGSMRGYWGYYNDTKLIDCDFENGPIVVGENYYRTGQQATVTLEDCRFDGGTQLASSTNELHGTSQGAPDASIPAGVPTTAKEAAAGTSDTSGGDSSPPTTGDGDQGEDEEATGTLLELIAGDDTSNESYEFTVDGSVEKRTSGGEHVAENNDSISENDDGTVTVTGVSGNGYGDAFYVNGVITTMDLDESAWTLRYDDEEVTVDDFALPNKLVIDGSATPNAVNEYRFTVSGKARKSAELGSINAYDEVEDGVITGRIIGGKDGYRFSGQITEFDLDGPADITVQKD